MFYVFFFQAEDGIRDLVRSRGLGDVYKRQVRQLVRQQAAHRLHEAAVAQDGLVQEPAQAGLGLSLIHI